MIQQAKNGHRAATRVGAILCTLICASLSLGQTADVQWWKGTIEVPGQPVEFVVRFTRDASTGEHRATLDIPVQSLRGLRLRDVAVAANELRFTIPGPTGGVFRIELADEGGTGAGKMQQNGTTFAVRMQRLTDEEARAFQPPRPQTPKPPFPYIVREVEYENPVDQTKLAGTLTVPEGTGPHPAILLITGSGAQDRDETIFDHKPFLVLADHLTRRGIAVLRVDDRGVGGSTGSLEHATEKTLANDVLAGLQFLKQQPEIDRTRLSLLGHSQGGSIAPLVASRSKDVACIVLLAASGRPGRDVLVTQNALLLRAAGIPEGIIETQLAAHRAVHQQVIADADEDALREAVRELVRLQLTLSGGGRPPTDEQLQQAIALGMRQFTSPLMRWFVRHDPREVLAKVKCPVLALGGELDLQVCPKENLPQIESALQNAGNPDVTVKQLPGLNHLFQEARTGQVHEYGQIEQTLAPTLLDEVTTWLCRRFGLD